MKKNFKNVYQFKITLKRVKPVVWRRIQVPETYSFWDLHIAIQDAMGWCDCHLHHFSIANPKTGKKDIIGIPEEVYDDEGDTIAGWERYIADYFSMENKHTLYEYDFGDGWQHNVDFEKILPRGDGVNYPLCVTGKMACPPEDVGGVGGYEDFLEIINDPNNAEYKEMLEWVGGEFEPEYFDPKEVDFWDPDERFRTAFQ